MFSVRPHRITCGTAMILTLLMASRIVHSEVIVEPAFPHLTFSSPVDLQNPGDGSNRLFVVEKQGTIRVFQNDPNASSSTVFLDISDRVDNSSSELGLLGLAFHPGFANNRSLSVRPEPVEG